MRIRNLLMMLAVVLLAFIPAAAQRTPPAPATPPSPSIAVPLPPGEPMTFSFSDGGGYLGISPENIDRENMGQYGLSAPRGVGISSVSQNSPAERAGLKKGDVILQFDGEPVTSSRKLLRLLGEAAPEQSVRLTISRNNSEQQLTVTLGQRAERVLRAGVAPDINRYFRVNPPNTPQVWNDAPGAYALGFGNNRRVGVTTTALTTQLANFFGVSGGHGLLITSISENSPASKAGLKAGDVITEVNGAKIEDSGDFIREVNRKEDGDVTLTIIRDKSERTIKVTPERRPMPSFNLSDFQPMPNAMRIIPPVYLMDLPNVRALQALPRVESFVLPKLDGVALPRMMNLPGTTKMPRLLNLPSVKSLLPLPCPYFD
jgi:membrane-associated protease RseP (regulator of RpoE activity)